MRQLKCQKGQGLIEYLIIVAMMGVASVGVIRLLNHTVDAQFTNVIYSLKGGKFKKAKQESVNESIYKKKDMSSFMNGAANKNKK